MFYSSHKNDFCQLSLCCYLLMLAAMVRFLGSMCPPGNGKREAQSPNHRCCFHEFTKQTEVISHSSPAQKRNGTVLFTAQTVHSDKQWLSALDTQLNCTHPSTQHLPPKYKLQKGEKELSSTFVSYSDMVEWPKSVLWGRFHTVKCKTNKKSVQGTVCGPWSESYPASSDKLTWFELSIKEKVSIAN